jgi:diguanylate cyclase (GGDEF)-like protein
LLLVDIDNLKMINDMRGHSTGGAVVSRTSDAIQRSVRPDDECARLGDDFLIYAPDCDAQAAKDIAAAILARLTGQGMPLAGAPFSVSVGIAVHEGGAADYASLHREADTALHQARAEGRNRIVIFDAAMAVPPQRGSPPKILV